MPSMDTRYVRLLRKNLDGKPKTAWHPSWFISPPPLLVDSACEQLESQIKLHSVKTNFFGCKKQFWIYKEICKLSKSPAIIINLQVIEISLRIIKLSLRTTEISFYFGPIVWGSKWTVYVTFIWRNIICPKISFFCPSERKNLFFLDHKTVDRFILPRFALKTLLSAHSITLSTSYASTNPVANLPLSDSKDLKEVKFIYTYLQARKKKHSSSVHNIIGSGYSGIYNHPYWCFYHYFSRLLQRKRLIFFEFAKNL